VSSATTALPSLSCPVTTRRTFIIRSPFASTTRPGDAGT